MKPARILIIMVLLMSFFVSDDLITISTAPREPDHPNNSQSEILDIMPANPDLQPLPSDNLDFGVGSEGYLIVTEEQYEDEFAPLANWKRQKGLPTYLETIENIDIHYSGLDLPEKIRNCIADYYANYDVKWVLLGGDHEEIPTRLTDVNEDYDDPYSNGLVGCDSYYADLDSNWDTAWGTNQSTWKATPEVYVGRLAANSESEMAHLISNILMYETNPTVNAWMDRALFAGSMYYFDEDWDDDDQIDYMRSDGNKFNNYLADQLLPEAMDPTFLGEAEGVQPTEAYYDYAITQSRVSDLIEAGATIGIIGGHANPLSMVRTVFSEDDDGDGLFDRDGSLFDDAQAIDTSEHPESILRYYDSFNPQNDALGLYMLDGCSAGTFNYEYYGTEYDCLSEMLLKTAAIGCVAGHNVVWGEDEWYAREHGGWFLEGITFRFYEQLMHDARPGKALGEAKRDLVLDRQNPSYWEENAFPGWEEKILKQMNLLGDPEVNIWLGQPGNFDFHISYSQTESSPALIKVVEENQAVPNATVTITNSTELLWKGITNSTGDVSIPTEFILKENLVYTISKPGFLPIIQEVSSFTDFNEQPQIVPSANISFNISDLNENSQIYWEVEDRTLGQEPTYNVTHNGVNLFTSRTWNTDAVIAVNISELPPGSHEFQLSITDDWNNTFYRSTIMVIIFETNDPPIIIPMNPFVHQLDNETFSIGWALSDTSLGTHPTYNLTLNQSTISINVPWDSGDEINITFNNLNAGNYTYEIIVQDDLGGISRSSIELVISPHVDDIVDDDSTDDDTTDDDTSNNNNAIPGYPFSIFGVSILLGLIVIYHHKKARYRDSS